MLALIVFLFKPFTQENRPKYLRPLHILITVMSRKRRFSNTKLIKTYLRLTMAKERLNG